MTDSFDAGVRSGMAKVAVDPLTAGAAILGGKQLAANLISRHVMKIPGARRAAQEVVGLGARAGLSGKKMPGRWAREAVAATTSPSAVSAFEHAHAAGEAVRKAGPGGAQALRDVATHPMVGKFSPDAEAAQKFIAGVPLESKGLRAAADYTLKPLGEVKSDIGNKARDLYNRVALKKGLAVKPEPT